VVVDPPFIVKEVWEKYARAVKLLAKPDNDSNGKQLIFSRAATVSIDVLLTLSATGVPNGKVILTTVIENADLLDQLLGAKPTVCITVLVQIASVTVCTSSTDLPAQHPQSRVPVQPFH
jgi:hypothetical protein